MIGPCWKPGQVFCNVHITLAIAEGINSVIGSYQYKIGAHKLYPKTVGFEMNLEDKAHCNSDFRLLDETYVNKVAAKAKEVKVREAAEAKLRKEEKKVKEEQRQAAKQRRKQLKVLLDNIHIIFLLSL